MTKTLPTKPTGETPIPKLTAIVLLAAIARDNGINWPDGVRFAPSYGHLELEFDAVGDLTAWVRAFDGLEVQIIKGDPHTYHTNRTPLAWNGWSLYVTCLVPVDQEPDVLDELVAQVSA